MSTYRVSKYLYDYESTRKPYPDGLAIAWHAAFEEIARQEDMKLAAVLKKRNYTPEHT